MRRPVKPFVTEYRGTGRRTKDGRPEENRPKGSGGVHSGRGTDPQRDNLVPRDLFRTVSETSAPDSYEAALRAADALFSPRPEAVVRSPVDAVDHAVASMTGAGHAPAGDPWSDGQHVSVAHEGGETTGRVLRALDEPDAEPPASLVGDPAPKRRGRKPGSVNKPKLPPPAQHRAGGPALPAMDPSTLAPAAHGHAASTSEAALLAIGDDALQPRTSVPPQDVAEPDGVPPAGRVATTATAKRREPFAWVRTKLRPGEKWKRRLPKVAW